MSTYRFDCFTTNIRYQLSFGTEYQTRGKAFSFLHYNLCPNFSNCKSRIICFRTFAIISPFFAWKLLLFEALPSPVPLLQHVHLKSRTGDKVELKFLILSLKVCHLQYYTMLSTCKTLASTYPLHFSSVVYLFYSLYILFTWHSTSQDLSSKYSWLRL